MKSVEALAEEIRLAKADSRVPLERCRCSCKYDAACHCDNFGICDCKPTANGEEP